MKAQGPNIPCLPALHLTPLSIEFHNWGTAKCLPGYNRMPLLLQKAEINNYTHADQHRLFHNWCLSTNTTHCPLGCLCQRIFGWNVEMFGPPSGMHQAPSAGGESPIDTPRREIKRQLEYSHSNNSKWVASFPWKVNAQKYAGPTD